MKINSLHSVRPVALGVALAAGAAVQPALADTTVFEDFSVSQGTAATPAAFVATTPGTSTSTPVNDPGPTDVRVLSVTLNNGENIGAYVNNGAYHYFQSSEGTRGSGKITWDLSAACRDWSEVTAVVVTSSQDHPVGMTVKVDGASATKALPANLASTDYSFTVTGNSCVKAVEIDIDGTSDQSAALDLDIDKVSIVTTPPPPPPPVPAISVLGLGASLIGLPLMAAGLARRRKRQ